MSGDRSYTPLRTLRTRRHLKTCFPHRFRPLMGSVLLGYDMPGTTNCKKTSKNLGKLVFPNLFGNRFCASPAHSESSATPQRWFSHRFRLLTGYSDLRLRVPKPKVMKNFKKILESKIYRNTGILSIQHRSVRKFKRNL